MQVERPGRRLRRRATATAAAMAVSALLSAGCSSPAAPPSRPADPSPPTTNRPFDAMATRQGVLGDLTAKGLVDALNTAGYPAPNPLNTTADECGAAGCLQSIVTDTLRVKSFATPGEAQLYAADRNYFQVTTLVVNFAPQLTHSEQLRYQVEIDKLVD